MWFDTPARAAGEALPVGTGRVSALCFGAVEEERLELSNMDTQVEPLGDLTVAVHAPHGGPVEDYGRQLDLRSGIHTVDYRIGRTPVRREVVCDGRSGVIGIRVWAEGGARATAWLTGGGTELAGVGADGTPYAMAIALHDEGDHSVCVYLAFRTGDRGPLAEPDRDPDRCVRQARAVVDKVAGRGWKRFRAAALRARRLEFEDIRLRFGRAARLTVDQFLARVSAGDVPPTLVAKLFHLGRHVSVTKAVDRTWLGSSSHTALPEYHESLVRFVERFGDTPEGAARRDGTWLDRLVADARLSTYLWEHNAFRPNRHRLGTVVWPVVVRTAELGCAWLDERHGPADHRVGALLRQVFTQVVEASKILGASGPVITRVRDHLKRLPIPPRPSALHDVRSGTAESCLVPAGLRSATPESAVPTGEDRSVSGASPVTAWARSGDGERAHAALAEVIAGLPPALHGGRVNIELTAAIAEMLLQSHTGDVEVLPALPRQWPEGLVSGLLARGGVTIDMVWKDSMLRHVVVQAPADGGEIRIRYQGRTRVLRTMPWHRHVLDSGLIQVAAFRRL
ncbi:glycoside hydrolase N-terminal domain-containing protein [Saccharothrix deserti]|uniref:glycoside hydrolase N-terminal domain-containing protein n=1 Tax=Saccharothrix deserti TaxID=2593674 RepID=UPI00131C1FCE|nr:glycoside hydrolase N-terminal domain-containing protein [Saccharothrix deserti]